MPYIPPTDVHSPRASWHLIKVLHDGGPGGPAYALGRWGTDTCIGFRWNGTDESPIGNPQSRGLPTWTILDPRLHTCVIDMLAEDMKAVAKALLTDA